MLFVHEIIPQCDLSLCMSGRAFSVMSLEKVRLRCFEEKRSVDLILIFVLEKNDAKISEVKSGE